MDYDFHRECLQSDIYRGYHPNKWNDNDVKTYMEKLLPNGFYVYDDADNIVDFDYLKLLDFVNSK